MKLDDYSIKSLKRFSVIFSVLGGLWAFLGIVVCMVNILGGILFLVIGVFLIIYAVLCHQRAKLKTTKEKPVEQVPKTYVFVTPSGKKFHYNPSCPGEKCYRIPLDTAKKKGYTECKRCNPYSNWN